MKLMPVDVNVSVCVPAYKRPHMLAQLVASFKSQSCDGIELVIGDDSPTDDARTLLRGVFDGDRRIRYHHNEDNLGFCRNLGQLLRLARGEVILLLGDDDLLLGQFALATYWQVFRDYPAVHFAYPNQVQIDVEGRFDGYYRHFDRSQRFPSGRESFSGPWLKSIQIAGLAVRRTDELLHAYPSDIMLFPQVLCVGRLLRCHESFGIAEPLVAVRAHDDQLGFHANRGKRIVGPERHQELEVMEIVAALSGDADAGDGPDEPLCERLMARALATNLPNERIRGSRRIAVENCTRYWARSQSARWYPLLWVALVACIALPRPVLIGARDWLKWSARLRVGSVNRWYVSEIQRQLAFGTREI